MNSKIQLNKPNFKPRQITVFDLFSGAGGFSVAAKLAGFCLKGAIESDINACITYRANLVNGMNNPPKLFEGDIIQFEPHDVLKKINFQPGELDLMIGGPPCQGFSSHRIKNAGIGDPRNELLLRYFDFVKVFRPKVFLVENVPGMLWPRHESYLKTFYHLAEVTGYSLMKPVKINAKDYGVPQNRVRVFLLGFQDKIPDSIVWPPKPTHCNPSHTDKTGLLPWVEVGGVFSEPHPKNDMNNIHMNHSEELTRRFKETPINGGSRDQSGTVLPCHIDYSGHKDVYGRIDPSKPGPTITTGCTNPSKGRFVHPIKHHGITVREAARIQTFPDSFVFYGGLGPAGRQIGNAVPVKLGEHILRHLAQYIEP